MTESTWTNGISRARFDSWNEARAGLVVVGMETVQDSLSVFTSILLVANRAAISDGPWRDFLEDATSFSRSLYCSFDVLLDGTRRRHGRELGMTNCSAELSLKQ